MERKRIGALNRRSVSWEEDNGRIVSGFFLWFWFWFFFFFVFSLVLFFFFFNAVLTWKIVEASKASVLYIYIYRFAIDNER